LGFFAFGGIVSSIKFGISGGGLGLDRKMSMSKSSVRNSDPTKFSNDCIELMLDIRGIDDESPKIDSGSS
jgi:hypothetical protein